MSRGRTVALIGVAAGVAVLVIEMALGHHDGVRDLFCPYYGGRGWLEHRDAYHLASVVPDPTGPVHRAYMRVGNVYPMTAVLLFLPLALLPATAASVLYIGLVSAGFGAALHATRQGWAGLLYVPMVVAAFLRQPTALVVVLLLFAWAAARAGRGRAAVLLAAVAVLIKPTDALLLAAVLLWEQRAHWRAFAAAVAVGLAASFAAQPDWLGLWLHAAATRNAHDPGVTVWMWWLIPLALLLWWRGDRYGAAAVAQTAVPAPIYGYQQAPTLVAATRVWPLLVGQLVLVLGLLHGAAAITIGLVLPRVLVGLRQGRTAVAGPPPGAPDAQRPRRQLRLGRTDSRAAVQRASGA